MLCVFCYTICMVLVLSLLISKALCLETYVCKYDTERNYSCELITEKEEKNTDETTYTESEYARAKPEKEDFEFEKFSFED